MKKLPLGTYTFSQMIEENYYYIDKTEHIYNLVENGKFYFLSRPRRFGKSCFLDTLKEAFEGNEKLFQGLFLEKNWNWQEKYPVVKISFGGGVLKNEEELTQKIYEILELHRDANGIGEPKNKTISGVFEELIRNLQQKYSQRVVILIDEYDKPILDHIEDCEKAAQMRDGLKNLYSVVKEMDAYLQFVFITGVSKFSRVSLFSGLNNLEDITLDKNFSSICGYTQAELETTFSDVLFDVNLENLKKWYNGYNFLGDKVYNPFDILLYLKHKEFKNYWFETGSPSFLIKLVQQNQYNTVNIEHTELSETELGTFDVDNIRLEVLLFQTGYLTIKEKFKIAAKTFYSLQYPNLEVKMSLTEILLTALSKNNMVNKNVASLFQAIQNSNINSLKDIFHSFFASIPHDWYRKNTIANYEGYYASIFYSYFTAIGLDVRPEDVTSNGQVDMTVLFESKVYVFEFKVVQLSGSGSALEQIKQRKYYEKYLGPEHRDIYLIGVEFSRDDRNITAYAWEKV